MARTMQTSMTRKRNQITLGFMAAIGLVTGIVQSASAQDATLAQQSEVAQPQQIFNDQQNRDPFSNRGGDQAGGVMDLVHRAMQAGSLSSEDFQSQQQENLDGATADFRAAQQKRLGGSPIAPAIAPTAITPTK